MGTTMAEAQEVRSEVQRPGMEELKLFAGNAHPMLAQRVADYLGIVMGKLTATKFADGELRVMVEESARGNDVYIIQPTCAPANDHIMELLIMLDAFKRASARRVTVVMPYYGYARQDKKIKPREPITARLIADLISVAGANRVVAIDLHAEQLQGFFNMPVDHLYGGPIISRYLISEGYKESDDVVVVSPDVGGVTRAKRLAEALGCSFAVIAKRRPEPNKVEVVEIVGRVANKKCLMIDDMIDTGSSIISGAEALMERGATEVVATCTHPILSRDAAPRLQASCIKEVVCVDTIPIPAEKNVPKLTVLPSHELIGEAIRRIHLNESISELFRAW
ncbi:MAG: ribose-phosphate pyrophosphokinae [Fimbriimonadaceae bacterium]|nr:ribose-phosphate pyrophosphokinae [Fimbriimonadaceae bacterium]